MADDVPLGDSSELDQWVAERTTARSVVTLPCAAERVLDAVADAAPLGELTRLVERDPTLAASIAKLACSAAYTGSAGERVSLPYAIMRLGREGLRCVCLTAVLAPVALGTGRLLPLRRKVWRECIASAVTCQAAAASRGLSTDDAYLAGLMHDFGKVVALVAAEASAQHADRPDLDQFWVELMERHHCDAGWVMTDAWRLPASIQSVTARHHLPSAGDPLHDVVQMVDDIVGKTAAAGWQISADAIESLPGVRSRDEAMALRIGLARHPFFFVAIGAAP